MDDGRVLKEQFVLVSGTWIEILDESGYPVLDTQPVPSGSMVELTRGAKVQTIRLHMLSDHVKSVLGLSSVSPITFANIAACGSASERHDRRRSI